VDAFETALVENLLREDMTVADVAHALMSWMQEADISIREMAKRTGKSHSAISTAIGVVRDPALSKAVADDKITPSQAREMLAVKGAPRLKLVDSVSERQSTGVTVSREEIRDQVRVAKGEGDQSGTLRTATTGSTPITGQRQGAYTPPAPQIDCTALLDRIIEAMQSIVGALPAQLEMGPGYYDREIEPRLRQIDELSAEIKKTRKDKSEAAA